MKLSMYNHMASFLNDLYTNKIGKHTDISASIRKFFYLCGWDMKNSVIRNESKDGF